MAPGMWRSACDDPSSKAGYALPPGAARQTFRVTRRARRADRRCCEAGAGRTAAGPGQPSSRPVVIGLDTPNTGDAGGKGQYEAPYASR
jgi:hypothetical protein